MSDTMRERFEEWGKKYHYSLIMDSKNTFYLSGDTSCAWEGYQAAQADANNYRKLAIARGNELEDAKTELETLRNKVAKYESDHPWAKANQEVMEEAVAKMANANCR